MAKGGVERGALLPVSADDGKGNGGGAGGDDAVLFKGSAMTRRGGTAALSYMACSVLLVMFNKAALSSYNFPCANVITLLQVITTHHTSFLGLFTLHGFISVALIVFGAFVAGARDLSFDARGYAIVFVANITTAIYLATINRIGKSSGLNSFGLMWCNGLVCGPSVLLLTYIQGDLKRAMEFPYLYSPGFMTVLLFSCILAFLLNYTIFWNTILNSALTQSMCGNLKDFFTVGIGWVLFGGLPFDLLNVIGQGLGFLGSGLYAYCKIKGK
ncbi:Nucleotide/sugar transporter family protein [Zea mays]|uniref:Nucleotide/sugar transporter family protein n=1 Tax=Zea mays TaxID=4577 RepID=A0A1D6Q4W5_MAIZE|nr:Nucleotide/sugar transporter family protein [Zea mays]